MRTLLVIFAISMTGCGGGGDSQPDSRTAGYDAPMRDQRAYIIKRLVLPTTNEQVQSAQFEYPGSGVPVNKLGALVKVLMDLLEGLDVQGDLDANYLAGEAPQMMVFESGPLDKSDGGVIGFFAEVVDADDPVDPSNDYSGSGSFSLPDGASLNTTWGQGSLVDGALQGSGTAENSLVFKLPFFSGEVPAEVPGVHPQIRVTIDENGIDGVASVAMTVEHLQQQVFPISARYLTTAIAMDLPRKQDIKNFFDDNNDDQVTVQELIDSPTMATLAQPDMDLDGDEVLDHLSSGVLIEAVRAEMVP